MRFPACSIGFEPEDHYDLAIVSVGYERRSSHLVRRGLRGRTMLAYGFDQNHVQSFSGNRGIAEHAGYEVRLRPPSLDLADEILEALPPGTDGVRVAVDISSMTRRRIASCVLIGELLANAGRDITVDYFYSPALYTPPNMEMSTALEAGPVLPRFAGRLRRFSLPVGAVIGLGYEPQRALGAFELLEPTRAWAFRPQSAHEEFSGALAVANESLLEVLGPESVFDYSVAAGVDLLYSLDSFIFALQSDFRLVLIPMGPKIFALACLLLGLGDEPERPAVWRIGEHTYSSPIDIEEDGTIVGLQVEFRST